MLKKAFPCCTALPIIQKTGWISARLTKTSASFGLRQRTASARQQHPGFIPKHRPERERDTRDRGMAPSAVAPSCLGKPDHRDEQEEIERRLRAHRHAVPDADRVQGVGQRGDQRGPRLADLNLHEAVQEQRAAAGKQHTQNRRPITGSGIIHMTNASR